MKAVREAWTDERLDDLASRMDRGFDRVDKDIRELRAETKAELKSFRGVVDERFNKVDERFDKVDASFAKIDERFERVHGRLDSIQRTMVAAAISITTAAIAGIAAVIATGP
jgi:methyl-accepting chemotaxis protein